MSFAVRKRYCGQVSPNTFNPLARACRIASIPSGVETCTMRIGQSTSSASLTTRSIASASAPRVWQMAW